MNRTKDSPIVAELSLHGVRAHLHENCTWQVWFVKIEKMNAEKLVDYYVQALKTTADLKMPNGWKMMVNLGSMDGAKWSHFIVRGSHILQRCYDAVALVVDLHGSAAAFARVMQWTFSPFFNLKIFTNEEEALLWLEQQKSRSRNWEKLLKEYKDFTTPLDYRERFLRLFRIVIPSVSSAFALALFLMNQNWIAGIAVLYALVMPLERLFVKNKKSEDLGAHFIMISYCSLSFIPAALSGGLESPFSIITFLVVILAGIFLKGRSLSRFLGFNLFLYFVLSALAIGQISMPILIDVSQIGWLKPALEFTCFAIAGFTVFNYFQSETKLKADLSLFKAHAESDSDAIIDRLQKFSRLDFSPSRTGNPTLRSFQTIHYSVEILAEALRSKTVSHQFLDTLINSLPLSVVLTDERGNIEFCNMQFLNLLQDHSPIGKDFISLLELEEGENYGIPTKYWLRSSTDRIPLKIRSELMDYRQLHIIEDLRPEFARLKERESIQKELSHSARLVSLGTMAAGLAHEVNNPLGAILGYAEIIFKRPEPIDRVKINAEKIMLQCRRIGNLINELRIFSRKDNTSDSAILRLSEIVRQSVSFFQDQFQREEIQIEISIPDQCPVYGRQGEIQSIIQNLLSNSRDAFHDRQIMNNKKITLTATHDNGMTKIVYVDNAGGIPSEIIDRVFDPFFTTKEPGRGTGLGMSIMRNLVEINQGTISLASTPGEGTKFTIHWPTGSSHRTAA